MQLTGWGRNEKAQGRRAKTSSGHDNFSQTANKAKKEALDKLNEKKAEKGNFKRNKKEQKEEVKEEKKDEE